MNNLDISSWMKFELGKLFVIDTGKDLIYSDLNEGDYPVIGHKALNNGITIKTEFLEDYTLYDNFSTISLADRGNFYAAVQPFPFYIGTRVKALKAKFNSNRNILLFIATIINQEQFRFAYGRNCCDRAETTIIKLPVDKHKNPDWRFMNNYIENLYREYSKSIATKNRTVFKKLKTDKWKEFLIQKVFHKIESCKCGNAGNLIDGNDIYYIGAKKDNNGIMKKVLWDEDLITNGNCIIFICDGQGSVGYHNYMDRDFIGSTTLSAGYNEKLNRFNGLFLTTVLDLERPKYSWGRKYRSNLLTSKIKLPADKHGEPDWQYMEDYVKSLRYADLI